MRATAALLVCVVLVGCKEFTGSFDDVVALEVSGPAARRVQEGDTLRLEATALDLAGNPIAAEIRWAIIDTAPGIAVDSTSGLVSAVTPGGPWQVQARTGTLRASPVAVTVSGAPDSVAVAGDSIVVASGNSASPAMTVKVFDLTTAPGTSLGLANVTVRFVVVAPVGAGIVLRAATAADSTATADSTAAVTDTRGEAAAVLRATGAVPDSIQVEARTSTAAGGAVTGSPVRFTVRFQ